MEIEEIKLRLRTCINEEYLTKSGSILYSSITTLQKGDFYILGLNPGGNPDEIKRTIEEDIDKLHNKTGNSYIDESWNWGKYELPKGEHPFQKALRDIFCKLNTDLREVFSCNLIFHRTVNATQLASNDYESYWKSHEFFLNQVQPKIIFTIGNSESNSAYFFLRQKFSKEAQEEKKSFLYANNKKIIAKIFHSDEYFVIGLPHLSRYSYISKNEEFLNWLQKKVNESLCK